MEACRTSSPTRRQPGSGRRPPGGAAHGRRLPGLADGNGARTGRDLEFEAVIGLRPLSRSSSGAAGRRVGRRRWPGDGGRRPVPAAAGHAGVPGPVRRRVVRARGGGAAAGRGARARRGRGGPRGAGARGAGGRLRGRRQPAARPVGVGGGRALHRRGGGRARWCSSTATCSPTGGSRRRSWPGCCGWPSERGVVLCGVTKHSSLSRGGAPLLGQLELEAASTLGERAMWWAPVARMRADVGARGCRWWRPGSTPTPGSPSGSTCRRRPIPRSCSARCRRWRRRRLPRLSLSVDRRRPAGRLPGVAAPGGPHAARRPLRPRRRAARGARAGVRRPPRR